MKRTNRLSAVRLSVLDYVREQGIDTVLVLYSFETYITETTALH